MEANVPPMASGALPALGHLVDMLRDRTDLFRRGYAEHGDVFSLKLGPKYAAVITGAECNRVFYTETDKTLNVNDGYTFLREALGEVLFIAPARHYYNQRPVIQEVFGRERMPAYIHAMNVEIQRWLDSLGDSGEVDLSQAMQKLTQHVAGRALIGPDFDVELGDDFWRNYVDISKSLDPILPPKLPLPKFWRRDRAKKRIRQTLRQLIDNRRAHLDRHDDLITTILRTPQKDGTIMSDDTMTALVIGLIFAGHETTAGQAAWLIALLLQHPGYLDLVQAEIRAHAVPGQPLDAMALSRLRHLHLAIDETTRLHPSADVQMRTVESPITLGGYRIPTGWRLIASGQTSHYMPDVFPNPHQFDPFRHTPERAEGKGSFSIIGFGGGTHKCMGINFAKNEMTIIAALFFQQFDAELISREIHDLLGHGASRPSEVLVRYRRKHP
jgi:sterol 14-demethylase